MGRSGLGIAHGVNLSNAEMRKRLSESIDAIEPSLTGSVRGFAPARKHSISSLFYSSQINEPASLTLIKSIRRA